MEVMKLGNSTYRLIRTLNHFFSIHIKYETGTDTVALTTKTFMQLCLSEELSAHRVSIDYYK